MTLVVDHLFKRFGSVVALDDLAFEVPQGQVFGFLGANGAGKTTTMRIALGVLEPDAGRITWRGVESHRLPRSTWGYLPEERGLYPRMRVIEQLEFFGGLHGVPADRARRVAMDWLRRFRAEDLADRRAEQLSKGNQQKIQFVAAVLHDPQVLLMDEPFTGPRPGQRDAAARGLPRAPGPRTDRRVLDPPDGGRGGAVRVGRDRRPRARRGRRADPRRPARDRAADGPDLRGRATIACRGWPTCRGRG